MMMLMILFGIMIILCMVRFLRYVSICGCVWVSVLVFFFEVLVGILMVLCSLLLICIVRVSELCISVDLFICGYGSVFSMVFGWLSICYSVWFRCGVIGLSSSIIVFSVL